jgi:glycerol-3-phosphate dehydrogenase
MVTAGGEGFVVIPWRGHTLIGPTDRQYDGDPDAYAVTREKIRELLDTINEAMVGNERIKFADVLHAYGGLRPLVHVAGRSVRDSSRKHVIYDNARDGCDGLLTVGGGKYTTSRNLARCVMKQVCRKLRVKEPRCVTDKQFLAGCEIPEMRKFIENMQADASDFPADIVAGLARTYGTECGRVLDLARADASLREPLDADGEIAAQAVFCDSRGIGADPVRHSLAAHGSWHLGSSGCRDHRPSGGTGRGASGLGRTTPGKGNPGSRSRLSPGRLTRASLGENGGKRDKTGIHAGLDETGAA